MRSAIGRVYAATRTGWAPGRSRNWPRRSRQPRVRSRPLTTEPFAGVVLTGGASTRMGTDKAFVEVDGQPLVLRVVEALRSAGADPVATIGGDLDRLRALGVDAYPDREAGLGPLGGIVTALEVLDAEIVFVAACDLIALSGEAVREVLDAMTPDADAVVPRSDRPRALARRLPTSVPSPPA